MIQNTTYESRVTHILRLLQNNLYNCNYRTDQYSRSIWSPLSVCKTLNLWQSLPVTFYHNPSDLSMLSQRSCWNSITIDVFVRAWITIVIHVTKYVSCNRCFRNVLFFNKDRCISIKNFRTWPGIDKAVIREGRNWKCNWCRWFKWTWGRFLGRNCLWKRHWGQVE